jgi:putative ABC transport system permease protein
MPLRGFRLKAGYAAAYAPMASQIQVERIDGNVLGGQTHNVTDLDVRALQDPSRTRDLISITPVITGVAMATYGQSKYQAEVTGSTADYLANIDQQLDAGEMFSDKQSDQRVVVLGSDIAAALLAWTRTQLSGRKYA